MKLGDKVKVWRIPEDGGGLCVCVVTIRNIPRGPGDLICVEHENGIEEMINPYSRYFDSITSIKSKG